MLQVKEKIPEYKTATSKSWIEMGRLEDLDVVIHPRSQTLTVNPENPFTAKHYLK